MPLQHQGQQHPSLVSLPHPSHGCHHTPWDITLPHRLTFFQACKLIFAPLRGSMSAKFSFQVLFTGFPQKIFCFGRFAQTSADE